MVRARDDGGLDVGDFLAHPFEGIRFEPIRQLSRHEQSGCLDAQPARALIRLGARRVKAPVRLDRPSAVAVRPHGVARDVGDGLWIHLVRRGQEPEFLHEQLPRRPGPGGAVPERAHLGQDRVRRPERGVHDDQALDVGRFEREEVERDDAAHRVGQHPGFSPALRLGPFHPGGHVAQQVLEDVFILPSGVPVAAVIRRHGPEHVPVMGGDVIPPARVGRGAVQHEEDGFVLPRAPVVQGVKPHAVSFDENALRFRHSYGLQVR